jgi:hypothetical protein
VVTIRILVTGSREWDDKETLWAELDSLRARYGSELVIVHGACYPAVDPATGERPEISADYLAHLWCRSRGVREETHPADWYTGGVFDRGAGPKRNQRMCDKGPYRGCCAFPLKGNGTWDCIKRANRAGIPVRIVPARGAKK